MHDMTLPRALGTPGRPSMQCAAMEGSWGSGPALSHALQCVHGASPSGASSMRCLAGTAPAGPGPAGARLVEHGKAPQRVRREQWPQVGLQRGRVAGDVHDALELGQQRLGCRVQARARRVHLAPAWLCYFGGLHTHQGAVGGQWWGVGWQHTREAGVLGTSA